MGKFVRRHRLSFATLGLLLALVISAATVIAFQSRRISRERDQARLERDKSKQALAFIEEIFKVADPGESGGQDLTAREILERGAARVEAELAEQPEIQAGIMNSLAHV